MSLLFANPELIRNARIQLRPSRVIAAGAICAAVSATIWLSIVHARSDLSIYGIQGPGAVFLVILFIQVGVLVIAGGIFSLQSVHREKELNTFDYQRVTRMTSLELAIGKLMGAPILAYFVVLCLMPMALASAIVAHLPFWKVVEAYVLLLLGAVAFHALALVVSVALGRSGIAVSMLLLLALVGFTSINFSDGGPWNIARLSPFYAVDIFSDRIFQLRDSFFGMQLEHTAVLAVLYVTFAAWFLLATIKNIKRDPSTYEILSPLQLFGLVMYVNLLMLGFLSWSNMPAPSDAASLLLVLSWWPLWVLTLILMRNRTRLRARGRVLGKRVASWWAATWPAPYVAAGGAIVGGAIILLVARHRTPRTYWNWGIAMYDVAFLLVWLSRDALYLQWMCLRRTKHPLGSAVAYLAVFYVCLTLVFSAFDTFLTAKGAAFTSIFIPAPFLALNQRLWEPSMRVWIMSLVLQAVTACLFAWLQKRRLAEFVPQAEAEETPAARLAQPA